jgi:uncharacterized membrane protein
VLWRLETDVALSRRHPPQHRKADMHLKISTVVEEMRSSLWFLPAISVFVAVIGALVLTRVEVPHVVGLADIVFSGGADGARGMLQAVTGSVITVTTLVFSLTVVTLQLASSQYSTRLLRTFLRDTGNQVVLSVFLATYAYTLMVLRTIEGGNGVGEEFVPQLAVSVAVLLTLASVGALVYYIDHIATEIRVDSMLRDVESDALGIIDRVHPVDGDGDEESWAELPDRPPDVAVAVPAPRSGFLTAVSTPRSPPSMTSCWRSTRRSAMLSWKEHRWRGRGRRGTRPPGGPTPSR